MHEPQWSAHYYRYFSKYSVEHDTPQEAFNALHWGAEAGELAPVKITNPDGSVLIEGDALDSMIYGEGTTAFAAWLSENKKED